MTINVTPVSTGTALATLKDAAAAQLDAGLKNSIMLWGKPGIGKTQIVEQLARHIKGKLYDVRLTTIDTSDLRGLPYYDHDTKTTQWYRPEDLPRGEEPAVLFLDELSSAPAHIQPTVYGLLQERRVGQHKIPDNVIIIAAGNGVTDGAVAYEMGTAIADRLIHIQVVASADDWVKNYAIPQNLHPAVVAFIRTMPQHFENTEASMKQEHLVATTPRSWEKVSNIMNTIKNPLSRRIMVTGIIGDAVATDFFMVAEDVEATVQVLEMIKRPRKERMAMVPSQMFGMNAMAFGLIGAANEDNIIPIFQILMDLADKDKFLAQRSAADQVKLKMLPLKELATFAMEQLMVKIVANPTKMMPIVLASPEYAEYSAERKRLGLE
jgi:AAA domain (dynein-related subfamily)